MTDIAALSFSVDTSGIRQATEDLRALADAASHIRITEGVALKLGDVVEMPWPRSRWAIILDRVFHPFTEPRRVEMRRAKITACVNSDGAVVQV